MSRRAPLTASLEAADVLAGTVVEIAGVPFRLVASDGPRAGAVASLFRDAAVSTRTPRCALSFGDASVATPTLDPEVTVGGVARWRATPDELVLRSPEGLIARSTPHEIVVAGDADELARVFRNVCVVALTHLFAAHELHLFHAGAVVIDEQAILVLGPTGSGKSTLTYAAVHLGWPVLADDLVALRRRDDGAVDARGMPRPISVPLDVLGPEPHGGRPVPEDHRRRTELPPGTLAHSTHPVGGIVVTGPGSGPVPTVERLPGLDALRQLLQANTSLADRELLPEVLGIAATLARRPAWSLRHGHDPSAALDDATWQLQAVARAVLDHPPVAFRSDGDESPLVGS